MFLETLAALGAEPELVARSTVGSAEEPARLAFEPSEPAGGDRPGMPPEVFNAWARTWSDEAVPALEGTTPRLGAQDARGRILLEAQLRDFEHRAAVNRARGLGVSTSRS